MEGGRGGVTGVYDREFFLDKFAESCVLPSKATYPQLPGFIFIVCF
jgi:hypothetical protein